MAAQRQLNKEVEREVEEAIKLGVVALLLFIIHDEFSMGGV